MRILNVETKHGVKITKGLDYLLSFSRDVVVFLNIRFNNDNY